MGLGAWWERTMAHAGKTATVDPSPNAQPSNALAPHPQEPAKPRHSPLSYSQHIPIKWTLLAWGSVILLLVCLAKAYGSSKPDETIRAFLDDFVTLFFSELAVALLVAFAVAYYIERKAKERDRLDRIAELEEDERRRTADAAEEERRRTLLAANVVEGVFGIQHKPVYVKAVVETALHPRVVRGPASLDYRLRELTAEEIEQIGVGEDCRFVALEMVSIYTFQNVSNQEEDIDVRYAVPVRHGAGARAFTRVEEAELNGVVLSREDIDQVEDIQDGYKSYSWLKKIPPNGEFSVFFRAIALKERSDNEVWGSFFATMPGTETRFSVLPGMRFGIRALTSSPRKRTRKEELLEVWKCTGPILPNNSMVFWWRTALDDAETTPETVIETLGKPECPPEPEHTSPQELHA